MGVDGREALYVVPQLQRGAAHVTRLSVGLDLADQRPGITVGLKVDSEVRTPVACG